MKFGEHWYDKLWSHLERVAEEGDEQGFNELMSIRSDFGTAKDKDAEESARVAFERWEVAHA